MNTLELVGGLFGRLPDFEIVNKNFGLVDMALAGSSDRLNIQACRNHLRSLPESHQKALLLVELDEGMFAYSKGQVKCIVEAFQNQGNNLGGLVSVLNRLIDEYQVVARIDSMIGERHNVAFLPLVLRGPDVK